MNQTPTPPSPPRVHRAIVLETEALSPGMMRVTLGGPDLGDYPTTGSPDEYVRLFFADEPTAEPRLPRVVGRGWEYPEGVAPAEMRTYTIRSHTPGRVTIDFVRHSGGLAADWAERVRPGGAVGLSRPFAQFAWGELPPGRLTLVADATALPAVERIVEETSPETKLRIFCEVTDERDARLPEAAASRSVDTVWIYRAGNGSHASRVADAFMRAPLATDGSETVWIAGESAMTRRVRTHLRKTLAFPAANTHLVGYWTDNEEAWRDRFDALDAATHARLDTLYAAYAAQPGAAREAVLDEIYAVYEGAGL
ncbi:MAG: siderophore-interacting protein [Microbacteriaceae bacterium]